MTSGIFWSLFSVSHLFRIIMYLVILIDGFIDN